MAKYILSIDQGTTGTTVMLVDEKIQVVAKATQEFEQIYPKPGWVEHNPEAIWESVIMAIQKVLQQSRIDITSLAGIGITNQRETTVIWDRETGQPIHNAIVWQDRRTADLCYQMKDQGLEPLIKERTGLVIDPYFSGSKINWMLEHVDGARLRAESGELAFGTIDTYLIWRLTGGAVHVTEVSNASRTMLFNLHSMNWDPELLTLLQIPQTLLPEVRSSSEIYGVTRKVPLLPDGIPVAGAAGDQQAALLGQAAFKIGEAKCTYGTGAFILVNTGPQPIPSNSGLVTTVGWKIGDQTTYALEGSAFIAGAAVQWIRDGLKLIKNAAEIEELARQVPDSGGVIFVPALVGLGAPHWRPEARGVLSGITRGTTAAHIARATLEGIALQIHDLAQAMCKDTGKKLASFRVDGGAAANDILLQFQADILNLEIIRPVVIETTALGSAFLAGLATGVWKNLDAISEVCTPQRTFRPKMDQKQREEILACWRKAVSIA